jgi:hypothetical protein
VKKKITQQPKVFVAFALVCLAMVGCGGVYDASVHGVVMLDSSPISRGTVSYSPTNGGPSAYGRIDSDGTYFLRTGREEGIPSGQYEVTVVANEPPMEKRSKSGGPPQAGKLITPAWYRSAKTSGLSYTVESGSNEINIDLSSEPPPDWKPQKRRRRSR